MRSSHLSAGIAQNWNLLFSLFDSVIYTVDNISKCVWMETNARPRKKKCFVCVVVECAMFVVANCHNELWNTHTHTKRFSGDSVAKSNSTLPKWITDKIKGSRPCYDDTHSHSRAIESIWYLNDLCHVYTTIWRSISLWNTNNKSVYLVENGQRHHQKK